MILFGERVPHTTKKMACVFCPVALSARYMSVSKATVGLSDRAFFFCCARRPNEQTLAPLAHLFGEPTTNNAAVTKTVLNRNRDVGQRTAQQLQLAGITPHNKLD